LPKRFSGIRSIMNWRRCGLAAKTAARERVSIVPGATAFTRMLCGAHSIASMRVRWLTPAFEIPYTDWPASAATPCVEAMLTIAPGRPAAMSCRPICWLMKNTPLRLTSMTASHSASVISTTGRVRGTPALLTSTSRWPKAVTTSRMARSTFGIERTSRATDTARAPALPSASRVSARSSVLSSDTATS